MLYSVPKLQNKIQDHLPKLSNLRNLLCSSHSVARGGRNVEVTHVILCCSRLILPLQTTRKSQNSTSLSPITSSNAPRFEHYSNYDISLYTSSWTSPTPATQSRSISPQFSQPCTTLQRTSRPSSSSSATNTRRRHASSACFLLTVSSPQSSTPYDTLFSPRRLIALL